MRLKNRIVAMILASLFVLLVSLVIDSSVFLKVAWLVGAISVFATVGIDLTTETPITLAEAARTLPGGAVHVSTIHRWRMKGVRGVRLETFLRGGVRHTSREAIERFFDATTAAADGASATTCESSQREKSIRAAENELNDAGI